MNKTNITVHISTYTCIFSTYLLKGLLELENFEKQIAPLALQVRILNSLMPSLFDIAKEIETNVDMNEWLVFHAISQQRALFPDIPAEIMEKILSHRFDSPFHTDENILVVVSIIYSLLLLSILLAIITVTIPAILSILLIRSERISFNFSSVSELTLTIIS